MSARDLIREAFRALESNRGRSLLTILGIVIGIASVIAMTSLIGGVRNSLVDQLGLNAARLVYISAMNDLDQDDLDKLSRAMPEYEAIEGSVMSYVQKKQGDESLDIFLTGASNRFFEMTGALKISSGRMFTEQEQQAGTRSLIIDTNGVKQLFGDVSTDAVGRTVTLNDKDYAIVGVVESRSGMSEGYMEAYLPLQTVIDDFTGGYERFSQVVGLVWEGMDVDEVSDATVSALAAQLGVEAGEEDDYVWCYSMKSSVDAMTGFMTSFQLIMGAVAGISLLVGGIGIMNMMLTNVTERIREIGIRRALGAHRRDITTQFLTESAVICVTGGIIGTVLGYLISGVLSLVANSAGLASSMGMGEGGVITPLVSPEIIALAVGLSIGIGIVFGYYPARRAAKLDPVECLRYQ